LPTFDLSVAINLAGIAVAVIASAIWLKAALVRQRHEELELLAETRGERIKDQEARILELERAVAEMRGQMQAIQALKATEIADQVIAQLNTQK